MPKYATYIIKAKTAKAEQIGRMIFVSSMRSYMVNGSFINTDVNLAITDDINKENVQIFVNDTSDNGKTISENFHTDGDEYHVIVHGDSDTYELHKVN